MADLKLIKYRVMSDGIMEEKIIVSLPYNLDPTFENVLKDLLADRIQMARLFAILGFSEDLIEELSIFRVNAFAVIFLDESRQVKAVLSY